MFQPTNIQKHTQTTTIQQVFFLDFWARERGVGKEKTPRRYNCTTMGTCTGVNNQYGCGLLALLHATLLDTSLLTCKVTKIVDTCTTYYTILVHLDLVDVG